MSQTCPAKTEVWARVVGFFRPVKQWNRGQRAQYGERKPYRVRDEKPTNGGSHD